MEVVTPGSRPLDSLVGAAAGDHARTVLVVDQAEDGLAEEVGTEARQRWVDAVVQQGQRGYLVIGCTDRVGALAAHPALARLVERGLYLLGGMGEEEARSAIEGPAGHAGLRLEHALVDLLAFNVRGEPGALPLLLSTCCARRGCAGKGPPSRLPDIAPPVGCGPRWPSLPTGSTSNWRLRNVRSFAT